MLKQSVFYFRFILCKWKGEHKFINTKKTYVDTHFCSFIKLKMASIARGAIPGDLSSLSPIMV